MISRLWVDSLAVERGERRLFTDFSLEIASGEAVALTGPNGAGKTSLMRAVAGLLRPAAGEVRFEGPDGPLDAEDARAGGMHLLGHLDGLKTSRTAGEELAFWAAWAGAPPDGVGRAVGRLELESLLDLDVRRLSAGQRRRLSLARLVAAPRPLWLLDEPLAPLDAARRALVGELMAEHLAGGGLILAAVHDPLPVPAREAAIAGAATPVEAVP